MRNPVVPNDLKMEESDDVDKICFVLAQSIARARGEPDLRQRVEAMEKANAIAEAELEAAKITVPNSKSSELDDMVSFTDADEGPVMIIKQRKEAIIKLGEMPCGKVPEEDDLKAQIAWFSNIATFLKELIDLGKKNSVHRDLAFSKDFADQLAFNFLLKLRRQLRKCEGEGQELFENMLSKVDMFREKAQEELNALKTFNDETVLKVDSKGSSENESMAEISANDAEKVDVLELSEQQFEIYLKDKLDDLKATTADVNSFDEPQKEFNAGFLSKKEFEHNLGEESRDNKGMEEHVETFEDMNGGLDDKFNVDGEADQINEKENPDENSEAAAEELSYPNCSTCVDADVYSEASVEKPRMFSEDKLPDAKAANKEVTQLERHDSSPENHVANLDEGKKYGNKATIDDEKDKMDLNDANAPKATVNNENELLDDFKTEKAELNAYEDSIATKFVPTIDLNANFVKEEIQDHSDGTSDDYNSRADNLSDVVKLGNENNKDFETSALDSNFERAFIEDDPNINGDKKKDVVLAVTGMVEDEVSAKELFKMKTVRIFKNKKYLQSKTFRIQEIDVGRFGVKEVMCENQLNDDHCITEDDGDAYVNVHDEIINPSHRDLHENAA